MSSKLWLDAYKPSLSSGVYGGYMYSDTVKFYPKQIKHYFKDQNKEYYSRNKFESTLKHIDFNIDVWYPYVSELTFDTKFISIPPKYAQSIMSFYQYKYSNANIETLNTNIVNNLRELHQILDKQISFCIKEWYDNNDKPQDKGVFIRFSNRSPKDGHKIHTHKNDEKYEHKHKEEKSAKDANVRFIEFCRHSAKDLFVDNGNDAMELLLSSERIFSDMSAVINAHKYPYKYLFYNQFSLQLETLCDYDEKKNDIKEDESSLEWNGQKWEICNVSIAIRKWEKRLRNDLEFRCFVYDKTLRAISQYKDYCYFPELGDNELFVECIKNKIRKYFKQYIRPKVPYIHYVFDIGIVILDENNKENEDGLECILIELNPYQLSTGSCLFNWREDEKQLKYAKNVEIRVHKQSVLTDKFVTQYLNEKQNEKHVVEEQWYQQLNKMEQEINASKIQSKTKKKDCAIL